MGRFLLQFEDQRTPLRVKKDLVASFFFILRRTAAIMGLGCTIAVLSSFALGEEALLKPMIEMINWATDCVVSVILPSAPAKR